MNKKDSILGIPSGEILKCKNETIYNLVLAGLVRYVNHIGTNEINCYCFKDNERDDILEIIFYDVGNGYDEIEHVDFGIGHITGLIGDKGYFVKFQNGSGFINLHISKDMLLSQKRVKLL